MTTKHEELSDRYESKTVEEHEKQEFEYTSLEPECKEENVPFLMPDYFTQRMKKANVDQVGTQVSMQMEVASTQRNGNNRNITNVNASDDKQSKVLKCGDTKVKDEFDEELLHSLQELTKCLDRTANTSVLESNDEYVVKMQKYTSIRYHSQSLCSYLLQTYFHINDGQFKPRQDEVCLSVLHHTNTLAVCPTGWGKSLCYQFPMLVYRLLFKLRYTQWLLSKQERDKSMNTNSNTNVTSERVIMESNSIHSNVEYTDECFPECLHSKLCLVISPLLSLMADQTAKINETNVLRAITLSSQMSKDRFQSITRELLSPLCEIDIIFVSPERLVSDMALRELLLQRQAYRLALLCIDEVHCLSQWGFDFRPSYMYISRLWWTISNEHKQKEEKEKEREIINNTALCKFRWIEQQVKQGQREKQWYHNNYMHSPTILCLTATATCDVIDDIKERFDIAHTVICTTPREHLKLEAINLLTYNGCKQNTCSDDNKHDDGNTNSSGFCYGVNARIERVWHDALVESAQSLPTPMLIYVQTRATADEIANLLGQKLHVVHVNTSCTMSNNGKHKDCATEKVTHQSSEEHTQYKVFTTHRERRAMKDNETENKKHDGKCSSVQHSRVVRCYHAALSHALRKSTQQQFAKGEIDILVATVAFGMGIDMPHIRTVLHAAAPSSIEHYIQETGRAGRDGEQSVCRLLYNPLEYYELRNRLLSSYISPIEMKQIVTRLLDLPFTHYGEKLMFISPSKLATEMELSEEAIETVLFMLLSRTNNNYSKKNNNNNCTAVINRKQKSNLYSGENSYEITYESANSNYVSTNTTDEHKKEFMYTNKDNEEWVVFEHLYGHTVQSYTLHRFDSDNESFWNDTSSGLPTREMSDNVCNNVDWCRTTSSSSSATRDAFFQAHPKDDENTSIQYNVKTDNNRKRSRYAKEKGTATSYALTLPKGVTALCNNNNFSSMCKVGVSMLLQQLNVKDLVLEYCRKNTRIDNIIEMANELKMNLTDLQFRLDELIESGCFRPRRTQSAYLVSLSSLHEENINAPERVLELVENIYSKYNEHLEHKLHALSKMFTVLAHPTHEALQASLNTHYDKTNLLNNTNTMSDFANMTHATRMKKMDAVAIANSFVEQNRQRIHNVYEAARALLGIRPRSVIKYGKYAGQLPLSTIWYVNSPYFGALREFDFQWVFTILNAHNINAQKETTTTTTTISSSS